MSVDALRCACGIELAPAALACPACLRLVHGEALRAIAARAAEAERAGNPAGALASWQEALALLPPDSGQHRKVREAMTALEQTLPRAEAPAPPPPRGHPWIRRGGVVAAVALLVWKLKFLAVLALGKAKLLLLGLTKLGTVGSMLASFGVYWAAWGWRFAAGLVASLYVHEMGHVAALRARGIHAGAPMFVPGLGAYVRLHQRLPTRGDDARVGLAGPVWGLAVAAAFWAGSAALASPLLAAIAQSGARLNLFNLLPVWELDGSRAFRALSRGQRLLACAATAAAWALSGEGMLLLVLAVAAVRALWKDAPAEGDRGVLAGFVAVLATLTAVATVLPVAMPG